MVSRGFLRSEQAVLIRGSGVDCDLYKPVPFPEKPVVMLASRMLWDKGVGEFVEASKLLNPQFPGVKFVLVGASDDENPKAIRKEQLDQWVETYPFIEWWGAQEPEKMPQVISRSTIVVLPSYYEGLPKVLLEAAAAGRPLVATDIPGCKEIVRDGVNGLLVKPRDPLDLANKIKTLLEDMRYAKNLGGKNRKIALEEFDQGIVVNKTLELYQQLLSM
jgi:glycosyltransferase involved in cell wall biosynthesis